MSLAAPRACALCGGTIDGPALHAGGPGVHPECVVARAPADAVVALLAALVLVAAPVVVVWAA